MSRSVMNLLMNSLSVSRRCIRRSSSSNAAELVPKASLWKTKTAADTNVVPEVSDDLVKYLERTSLVEFSSEDSRKQLYESIVFASQLRDVQTDGVEPLHTLLESEVLYLRDDEVTEGSCRDELMALTAKNVENLYYLAPPGNVPLDQGKGKDGET